MAGTASKSRWRASLAGVTGPEAAAKLAERQEVVRVTASDALEELLEVGLDAAGDENGSYTISDKTQSLVTVFQGASCQCPGPRESFLTSVVGLQAQRANTCPTRLSSRRAPSRTFSRKKPTTPTRD